MPPTSGRRPGRFGRLDETLQPLLLTPPSEFVAARTAAAHELRRAGRRDEAAAIAAIRRPAWTDWALNRIAAHQPDLAERFAAAADAMRAAQDAAIRGGAADVATALRSLRDASSALTRAAGGELRRAGRAADVAGLTERLNEVAADAASTAALRSGVLVARGAAPGIDAAAAATDAPADRAETGRAPHERERARRLQRLERELAELDARTDAIERDRHSAAAAEADALAALERARAELAAAEMSVTEAVGRRDDAERALAEHERRLARHRRELLTLEPADTVTPQPPEGATGTRRRRP